MATHDQQVSKFKISGQNRRELKKQFNSLKRQRKMMYFYNDIDTVYGGGLSEKELEERKISLEKEIEQIQNKLNEQY